MSDLDAELDQIGTARKKGGLSCYCCTLPQEFRDAMRNGRAKGHTFGAIAELLTRHGYPVKETSVAGHFRKGHEA